MSHGIEKIEHFPRGDTKVLPFSVYDDDGEPLNLQDADISWGLRKFKDSDVLLSLEDDGVSIQNRENGEGEFEIHIEAGATDILASDREYRERVRIVDDRGNRTTWIGKVEIVSD